MLITKAFAAIQNPVVPGGNAAEEGGSTLANLIAVLWKTVIIVGGLAFLIFFVWGGIEWITAGGDKQKIETAKNKLTQGLIGLAVLAGSLVIIKFASQAIGIDLLNIVWPTPTKQQSTSNSPSSSSTTSEPAQFQNHPGVGRI